MFGLFKSKKKVSPLNIGFSTDVHSHILPGIDDGSENIEESIALIRRLQSIGIKRIVATPHITEEVFPNNPETIKASYQQLRKALDEEEIDIEILYSAEYRLDSNFLEHLHRKELIPFPQNYLLIENSFLQPYWKLEDMIFQLNLAGYKPILAHPERYTYYHSDFSIYDRLQSLGCKFQVNILSVAGCYGKETRRVAMHLLDKGYINFLATDVHHLRHTSAIEAFLRGPDFEKISSKLNILNDTI